MDSSSKNNCVNENANMDGRSKVQKAIVNFRAKRNKDEVCFRCIILLVLSLFIGRRTLTFRYEYQRAQPQREHHLQVCQKAKER